MKKNGKRMMSSKYLDRYIGLHCSEELQGLKIYPNAHEVTEAFGLYNIIEEYIVKKDENIKIINSNVICYCIGDGVAPRIGALISFLTKWQTISIDPLMREEKYTEKIQRCIVVNAKAEDVIESYTIYNDNFEYVLLIFPHSHIANTNEIYKWFKNKKTWIINMPCCHKKQDDYLPLKTWVSFKDEAVASPENIIKVYCNYIDLV